MLALSTRAAESVCKYNSSDERGKWNIHIPADFVFDGAAFVETLAIEFFSVGTVLLGFVFADERVD